VQRVPVQPQTLLTEPVVRLLLVLSSLQIVRVQPQPLLTEPLGWPSLLHFFVHLVLELPLGWL